MSVRQHRAAYREYQRRTLHACASSDGVIPASHDCGEIRGNYLHVAVARAGYSRSNAAIAEGNDSKASDLEKGGEGGQGR